MSHLSVQILESSLQTSFPWSSFHVAEHSTWFPSLHGIDPVTHTNRFTVSQGPKSKLLSERIQMLCLFQELTPDFIKSSWGERSGSASMGPPCEDGREGNSERSGQETYRRCLRCRLSLLPLSVLFLFSLSWDRYMAAPCSLLRP